MKRVLIFITALILLFSCVNVTALESTVDEASPKYDYSYGFAGDYEIVYIAPESFNKYYKAVDLVYYCFSIKCETVPFYFVKADSVIPIENALNNGIDKTTLKEASDILKEAEVNRLEPFASGKVCMYKLGPEQGENQIPQTEDQDSEPGGDEWEPVPCGPQAPNNPANNTNISSSKSAKTKPKLNIKTATLKCGKSFTLSVKNRNGKGVKFSSNNKKTAVVNKKGVVTTLRRGRAKITAKVGSKTLTCVVKVINSPSLSKSKIKIKKGKSVTLKINGKSVKIKNKYKNCKCAKIVSKKSASQIRIKGVKKGRGVIKITVNKMTLKLKVKVK